MVNSIKQARIKKQISKKELASQLMVPVSYIECWELELFSPSTEKLKELSKLLDTSIEHLLSNDTREPLRIGDLTEEQKHIVRKLFHEFIDSNRDEDR